MNKEVRAIVKLPQWALAGLALAVLGVAVAADVPPPQIQHVKMPAPIATEACKSASYGDPCKLSLDGAFFLKGVCQAPEGSPLVCGPVRGFNPSAGRADDPNRVWARQDLIERGATIYRTVCSGCHQPDGRGRGNAKPLDAAAVVLDRNPARQISVLLNGAANGAMPSWKELSDTDVAALVTFTKNQWSNQTGQVVQPSEVKAARQ